MSESIKVFQNLYDEVIEFESKEQFMNYYERNKSKIDAMKTRGINVKFKIPGYRIGRKQNQILLFPTEKKEDDEKEENQNLDEINEKLNLMNKRLKKIEDVLCYLCDILNPHN